MFLIVDNERRPDARNQSTALLLDALRELHCDHELLKGDAVMDAGGLDRFVGIVLSDGHLAPREEIAVSGFRLDFQVLLGTSVPILGIGTGARIIAEAYGALVQHREAFEEHEVTAELSKQSVLFDFLMEAIRIRDDRPDHIVQAPPCFDIVASSGRGPAHAIQHRSKELYAMYFSIASAGDAGKTIVKNFLRYAGTSGGAL